MILFLFWINLPIFLILSDACCFGWKRLHWKQRRNQIWKVLWNPIRHRLKGNAATRPLPHPQPGDTPTAQTIEFEMQF
jgi:hypothetical protein